MAARRVVCPGCKTTLQLPETMREGKVKCPKCQILLTIRAPASQPAARQPAPAQADLFGDVPGFGSAPTPANPSFGFPAAQRPGGMVPNYRTSPGPAAPGPTKRKKSGGGGNKALKIVGIVSAIGFGCILLCAGGLFAFAKLGSMHSGWKPETFHGYTINMPAGDDRKTKSQQYPRTTVHELAAKRKESGSQYSLVVAKVPAGPEMNIEELVKVMGIRLLNQRSITRDGVSGVAGEVDSGFSSVTGSESEMFYHNGNLIFVSYAPYSKIQHVVGGTRAPRKNERELDKPEDFFASIKFQ